MKENELLLNWVIVDNLTRMFYRYKHIVPQKVIFPLQTAALHVILLVHMIYNMKDHRGIFRHGAGGNWQCAATRGITAARARTA
jgi:hypothetical protein